MLLLVGVVGDDPADLIVLLPKQLLVFVLLINVVVGLVAANQ